MNDYDYLACSLLDALRDRLPIVSWSTVSWDDVHARYLIDGDMFDHIIYITALLKVGWGTMECKTELEVSIEIAREDIGMAADMVVQRVAYEVYQGLLHYKETSDD